MTPELIYIIELFISFCFAFFIPCFVINKIVEAYKTGIAKMTPEERATIIERNRTNDLEDNFYSDNLNINPMYSNLPNNIFYTTHNY